MEGLGPHHSKIKERAKTSYIWTTGEGGGGGGGVGGAVAEGKKFSIYFVQDRNHRQNKLEQPANLSFPQNWGWSPPKAKMCRFPILDLGQEGLLNILSIFRL